MNNTPEFPKIILEGTLSDMDIVVENEISGTGLNPRWGCFHLTSC